MSKRVLSKSAGKSGGETLASRKPPLTANEKLKKRVQETKGLTKDKKFKAEKKIQDAKDKKKIDAKDKKNISPKMEKELKASGLSQGEINDLKKSDTITIKKLNALKKNIGDDQIGKINRLFSQKAEGNIKGKQQMKLSTIPAKSIDDAVTTVNDLYDKIKSGKYSQSDYRKFMSAQSKVKNAMSKRGDVDIKVAKSKLMYTPPNPSDAIKGNKTKSDIIAIGQQVTKENQKKNLAKAKKNMTPEQKKAAKEFVKKLKLKKEKEELGFNVGGLTKPTANQTGLKKLPTAVRNKMGYMYGGGMPKKPRMSNMDYRKGGLVIMIGQAKPMKKGKK